MSRCAVCSEEKPDCTLIKQEDDLPEMICATCQFMRADLRATAQIWQGENNGR